MLRVAVSVHTGAVSAYDVIRVLQHGGSPTPLGEAITHYGRIFKTMHVLTFVDNEPYPRQIKGSGPPVPAILRAALSEALYPGYSDATAQLGGETASGPARGPLLLWLRPRRTPRDGGQRDA